MSGGNHNNLFHSGNCSLRLRRKLENQSRWHCSCRRPSPGTWWNEANWTVYNQMLTYWSLIVCVIDALYCDTPQCESVCVSLVVAVVYGDSCPRLQPLEKQWNQLLCERRTGLVRRHCLVRQHQRCEYQQSKHVLMDLISWGQHVSLWCCQVTENTQYTIPHPEPQHWIMAKSVFAENAETFDLNKVIIDVWVWELPAVCSWQHIHKSVKSSWPYALNFDHQNLISPSEHFFFAKFEEMIPS